MNDRLGSAVRTEALVSAAVIAALAVAAVNFVLALLLPFPVSVSVASLLGELVGALIHAATIFGVLWVVVEGTDERVVATACVAVFATSLLRQVLSIASGGEIGLGLVIYPLMSVAYFLGFVLAYRIAFEERDVLDWDLDRLRASG